MNEKTDNREEFLKILETYKSITLDDLKEKWTSLDENESIIKGRPEFYSGTIMKRLLGFGSPATCILCSGCVQNTIPLIDCNKCLYVIGTGDKCTTGRNKQTYMNISHRSNTPEQLFDSIQERIKHIEKNVL